MSVTWVKAEMPLGGIDAQTDPVHVLPGKLLELKNGRFDQLGGISKRPGYSRRTNASLQGAGIVGKRLAERPGGEQLQIDLLGNVHAWSPTKVKWVLRGTAADAQIQRDLVYYEHDANVVRCDIATANGVEVVSWGNGDTVETQNYRVRDSSKVLVQDRAPGPASSPHLGQVIPIGNFIYAVAPDVTALKWSRIDTTATTHAALRFPTFAAFGTAIAIKAGETDLYTIQPLIFSTNRWIVAWKENADNNLYVALWDTSSTPVQQWRTSAIGVFDLAVAVRGDTTKIWVAWADSTNGVRTVDINPSTGALGTVRTVSSDSDSLATARMTTYVLSSTKSLLAWERKKGTGLAVSENLPFVRWQVIDSSSGVIGSPIRADDVSIAADSYDDGFFGVVLPVIHSGAGYGTGLLLRIGSSFTATTEAYSWRGTFERDVAAADLNDDNTLSIKSHVPHSISVGAGVIDFAVRTRERLFYALDSDGTLLRAHTGVTRVRVAHRQTSGGAAGWGRSLFLTGGRPSWYDGSGVAEHGFAWPPSVDRDAAGEDITDIAGGVFLTGEKYQVQLAWVYEDSNGIVDTSEPSKVLERTIGAVANRELRVTLNNGLITDRKFSASTAVGTQIPIVMPYRTTGQNATVPGPRFYRAFAPVGFPVPALKTPGGELLDFGGGTVDENDAGIQKNEVLYTDGGILPNTGTPPCEIAVVHGGRMWLGGLPDPHDLYFSQPLVEIEAPRFNPYLRIRLDDRVRGMASLDDRLIVYSGNSIRSVTGSGPPAAGDVDIGFYTELLTSEVGCNTHRTIVQTPLGHMFFSHRGFMLLDRGLNVSYIGAAVERLLQTYPVPIGGTLVPHSSQVRWLVQDLAGTNRVLFVYDYKADAWSLDTLGASMRTAAVDLTTWGREVGTPQFVVVDNEGQVYEESTAEDDDFGTFIPLDFTTPWIKLDTLQGWQRVRGVTILGRKPIGTMADIQVYVGYDYDDTFTLVNTFTAGHAASIVGNRLQLRARFRRQKCEAVRLRIVDAVTESAGANQGLRVSSLVFEAGLKRGTMKLPVGAKG